MPVNTSSTNTKPSIEPEIAVALKQIEAFADKYGQDHLVLAMHLAFPLAVTADLAYQIRNKFCQNIAWVAVSDCLLSYLWHEVNDDLYEVDVTVRQVLLHELQWSQLGEERLRDLARFLLGQLHQYSKEVRYSEEVLRLYEWIGNSYVAKKKAVESIVKTINSLLWHESLELIRIGTIINSLAEPLSNQYSDLFNFSNMMLQCGYSQGIDDINNIVDNNFSKNIAMLKIAGVNLLIPRFFQFETVTVNRKGEIIKREEKSARYFREVLPGGVELDMVEIPGGKFIMGSPETEKGRDKDENRQHEVTVKPFFMGKYPITQEQYKAIMGTNPSLFNGKKRPVENITWEQTIKFCEKLSKLTGKRYSLPSEAEWEYAGRAGTMTPFYFGETITSDLANYDGNYTYAEESKSRYRQETTDVGIFPPNLFGLYDIHGNVWEWCQDIYYPNYEINDNNISVWVSAYENNRRQVCRGGSWGSNPNYCRLAKCGSKSRPNFNSNIGFRVSCEVV